MKELAALAYRDTTSENRTFWKNEMSKALREIQEKYDEKLTAISRLEGILGWIIKPSSASPHGQF